MFKIRYRVEPSSTEGFRVVRTNKYSNSGLVIGTWTKKTTAVAIAVFLNAVRNEEVDSRDYE